MSSYAKLNYSENLRTYLKQVSHSDYTNVDLLKTVRSRFAILTDYANSCACKFFFLGFFFFFTFIITNNKYLYVFVLLGIIIRVNLSFSFPISYDITPNVWHVILNGIQIPPPYILSFSRRSRLANPKNEILNFLYFSIQSDHFFWKTWKSGKNNFENLKFIYDFHYWTLISLLQIEK